MPIYEYECASCHHLFDQLQKINDDPLTTCPECQKNTAIRLVSAAGFQLKGTGWYATDFKDKGKPKKTDNTATSTDTKPSSEVSTTTKAKDDK